MAELTAAQEQQLQEYILRMYGVWLPAVEAAVLGGTVAFGMRPNPTAITTTVGMWRQQIMLLETQQLAPIAAEAYEEEDPAGSFSISDAIIAGAAAATLAFLLAQIGELQAALTTALATATGIAAAAVAMRELLNPANSFWRFKSAQVAQTEGDRWVQAATLAAAITAQRRDGIAREKTWVTRDDDRVRPTHMAADGQTRPVRVAFNVGGLPMMYPKDPSAPPELVVNCRCGMRITKVDRHG